MADQEVFTARFDSDNINWCRDGEYNILFVHSQQNYFNMLLKNRGHVFLNEVNDALGFDRTSRGQLVGWTGKNGQIDFGLETDDEGERVYLTFNVDGEIYEELDK